MKMHEYAPESSAKEVVGLRLLDLRRRLGWTQGVLAAKLGVSDRTYKYYEQGQRDAPVTVLLQVAALAGADMQWLLTGEGRKQDDLDLYDRAVKAAIEDLPKRGVHLDTTRALKLARQAYANAMARNTAPEDEVFLLSEIIV